MKRIVPHPLIIYSSDTSHWMRSRSVDISLRSKVQTTHATLVGVLCEEALNGGLVDMYSSMPTNRCDSNPYPGHCFQLNAYCCASKVVRTSMAVYTICSAGKTRYYRSGTGVVLHTAL